MGEKAVLNLHVFRFAVILATVLTCGVGSILMPAPHAVGQQIAVKGGKVITMAGEPIEDGVVLIREGKIVAVGKEVSIPLEARVIDAKGKVVMPGFIEAHSSAGMSQPNETNSNVPFLSVLDSIDPGRDYFEDRRRNGVTTIGVSPGNNTMIGGQTAILKSAGGFVDEMAVKRRAGIKISLKPSGSNSRMNHYAKLRNEFEKARRGQLPPEKPQVAAAENGQDSAEGNGEGNGEQNRTQTTPAQTAATQLADAQRRQAALQKLLSKEMPAIIYCENAMDALQAIRLTEKYGLKSILVLGRDCYQAAQQIAKSKLPVILDPTLVYWKTDPRTNEDEKVVVPQVYRKHEIPVTFQTSDSARATLGSGYLWYQAATAVKYGTPIDEALRSITLRPAELLGVSDIVGSLEKGKDADMVILSGDPLKVQTWVETTIVRGEVVYQRDKDTKLQQLLRPKD